LAAGFVEPAGKVVQDLSPGGRHSLFGMPAYEDPDEERIATEERVARAVGGLPGLEVPDLAQVGREDADPLETAQRAPIVLHIEPREPDQHPAALLRLRRADDRLLQLLTRGVPAGLFLD